MMCIWERIRGEEKSQRKKGKICLAVTKTRGESHRRSAQVGDETMGMYLLELELDCDAAERVHSLHGPVSRSIVSYCQKKKCYFTLRKSVPSMDSY
jgi:hypothetical protein